MFKRNNWDYTEHKTSIRGTIRATREIVGLRMIKSRIRWAGNVTRMRMKRYAYRI
jgi:hypothetical protein